MVRKRIKSFLFGFLALAFIGACTGNNGGPQGTGSGTYGDKPTPLDTENGVLQCQGNNQAGGSCRLFVKTAAGLVAAPSIAEGYSVNWSTDYGAVTESADHLSATVAASSNFLSYSHAVVKSNNTKKFVTSVGALSGFDDQKIVIGYEYYVDDEKIANPITDVVRFKAGDSAKLFNVLPVYSDELPGEYLQDLTWSSSLPYMFSAVWLPNLGCEVKPKLKGGSAVIRATKADLVFDFKVSVAPIM